MDRGNRCRAREAISRLHLPASITKNMSQPLQTIQNHLHQLYGKYRVSTFIDDMTQFFSTSEATILLYNTLFLLVLWGLVLLLVVFSEEAGQGNKQNDTLIEHLRRRQRAKINISNQEQDVEKGYDADREWVHGIYEKEEARYDHEQPPVWEKGAGWY